MNQLGKRRVLLFGVLVMLMGLLVSAAGCNCGEPPALPERTSPGDGGFADFTPPPPPPDFGLPPSDGFLPEAPKCIPANRACTNDVQCNPACSGLTQVCFEGICQLETPPPPDLPPTDQMCPVSCTSINDCGVPACGNRTQCVNGACSFIPPRCPAACRSDADCQTPSCGSRIQCVQRSCTAPPECPAACFQDSDCKTLACGPKTSCEGGKCIEPVANNAPIADAGTDTKGTVNQRTQLNGKGSSDPDGDSLTFSWRFVTKPAGSLTALDDPTSATPAFVPDKEGQYVLELVVNDGRDSSQPDTVSVSVQKDQATIPSILSLGPSQLEEGYPAGTFLALFGNNFVTGARVSFNGAFVATRVINPNSAAITLANGLKPGQYAVFIENPGGVKSNTVQFVITQRPSDPPVLTRLTPAEVDAGTAFTLTVFGSKFVSGAAILYNGNSVTTTFVSATELSAQIKGQSAGTYKVQVQNPDGKTSGTLTLLVKTVKLGPVLTSITPTNAFAGQAVNLQLTGQRFEATSSVSIGGKIYPSVFRSATRIDVQGLNIATAGQYIVFVENQGGLQSNQLLLIIDKALAAPRITSLSPASVFEKTAVSVAVKGSSFVSGAKVTVKGASYPTTFVSATELRVDLPNTLTVGSYPVLVTNPDNKTSNTVNLSVTQRPPQPAITKLDPNRVALASTPTITVTGSNFVSGAQVQVGTRLLTTTFVSDTELSFSLPGNFQVGTYNVRVFNPDNQTSNVVQLTVFKGPAPTLTALQPSTGVAGSVITLTLTGTNFVNGSNVIVQGGQQPTTFLSATSLQTTLSLSSLAPGDYDVWVENPDKQTSQKLKFKVTAPTGPQLKQLLPNTGQTGTSINLIVDGAGLANGATIQFNGKTIKATFLSTSTLGAVFDLTGINAGTYPVTVTNPNGAKSNIVYFTVTAQQLAKPILTVVNPSSISISASTPIYLLGQHFQNNAVMVIQLPFVGGFGLPSNFVNSTTLVINPQFPRIPIPFPAQRTNTFVRNPDKQESNRKQITVSR